MSEIFCVCIYPSSYCTPFSYKVGKKFKKGEIVTKIEHNDKIVTIHLKDEIGETKTIEFHGLSYSLEFQ